MHDTKNKARRSILRTLVLGGSATAASQLLPDSWIKPVVNQVLTPAHAQTSISPPAPIGFFQTNAVLVTYNNGPSYIDSIASNTPQSRSVLDFFISPAEAGMAVDACDNASPSVSFDLSFGIPVNPGTATVCVTGLPSGGDFSQPVAVSGNSISDISVGDVSMTNIMISDSAVSGNINYLGQSNVVCNNAFSAPLTDGMFGCSAGSPT